MKVGDKVSFVDEVGDASPVSEFANDPGPDGLVTFKLVTGRLLTLATFGLVGELAVKDFRYSASFAR